MNKQNKGKVLRLTEIAADVFKVTLKLENMPEINPGQFLNVKIPGGRFTLRRPFGISGFDHDKKTIDFCFQIKGDGTKALSEIEEGTDLDILLPLGNGFPMTAKPHSTDLSVNKKIMIIGGGIGIFPLLPVAKAVNKNCYSFLGFRSANAAVLTDEFKNYSKETFIATDDGTAGEKGFITDIARREFERIKPDAVFACGPLPMFKALKKTFSDVNVPVYISMEERMACGFGACLCCNTKIQKDGEIKQPRICCEGPIFLLSEVIL